MTDDAWAMREQQKDGVLSYAFQIAAFDGWSHRTLMVAGRDAGLDPATMTRLFPSGTTSLLEWMENWLERELLAAVDPVVIERLSVRERIAYLVRKRFEILEPHKEALRRLALYRSLPSQWRRSSKMLWSSADSIWELAGFPENADEGSSRYTRRGLLSGILFAFFYFWLEDESPDHQDSWAFLDRRIADALTIGKAAGRLKSTGPFGFFRKTVFR